jgi:glycosyltransferase involved in cell wall biosynthesis
LTPFVSVIVRAFRRPGPLEELIARLRAQTYPAFEIVVVEQSEDPALLARLEALGDPRLRVLARPPLGAPGARNEAIRHARGDILLLIDDDDLPVGDGWIAAHVAAYQDPLCVGVVGRLSSHPAGKTSVRFPRITRFRALRYTFWKDTWGYVNGPLPKRGARFLIGSNASVRRALVERVGGWDEGIGYGEEQSFSFRFHRSRRRGEYFAYDPAPVIHRRVDVPGGLDRRTSADWYRQELAGRVAYYHRVVGHYFPWRFRLLYPLFVARAVQQAWGWIWDNDNKRRGTWGRVAATLGVIRRLPGSIWRDGWRPPPGGIRRQPRLDSRAP